jgi:hypothetical protein
MTTPGITFTTSQQNLLELQHLKAQLRNCTSWFYWIAGLSILNSVISITGASFTFVIGLGATQIIDALANLLATDLGGGNATVIVKGAGLFVNLIIAGIIALFGYFAVKGKRWALITGMILYLADAVLLLVFKDWLGVLFHGWALFSLYKGLSILTRISKLEPAIQTTAVPVI